MASPSSAPNPGHRRMSNQLITAAPGEYIFPPFLTTPHLFLNNSPTLTQTTIKVSQERKPFSRENEFQYPIKISPHATLLEKPRDDFVLDPATLHTTLRILVWNCRGARRSKFLATARDLIRKYQPHVFIVLETRLHGHIARPVMKSLSYSSCYTSSGLGYVGGFWLLRQSHLINNARAGYSHGYIRLELSLKPIISVPLQIQSQLTEAAGRGRMGLMEDVEVNTEQAAAYAADAFWDYQANAAAALWAEQQAAADAEVFWADPANAQANNPNAEQAVDPADAEALWDDDLANAVDPAEVDPADVWDDDDAANNNAEVFWDDDDQANNNAEALWAVNEAAIHVPPFNVDAFWNNAENDPVQMAMWEDPQHVGFNPAYVVFLEDDHVQQAANQGLLEDAAHR